MSQLLPMLPAPTPRAVPAESGEDLLGFMRRWARELIGNGFFTRSCRIGWRWLRYQVSPWTTLAIAPIKLLFASGLRRTQAQLRCMGAIGKIDFAAVYGLLNDLLV